MTESLDNLRRIVAEGLCHRCGSCAGICPAGVIGPDDEQYPSWADGDPRCTGCGLCVRVCPGSAFLFPAHSRSLFGREVAARDAHGLFLKAFRGYSLDPAVRKNTTSGGIATQLALHLLEKERIRGSFAVVPDDAHPWKPRAVVARTREEILRASYSKYPACSMNHLFREVRSERGPFAYVGIPCQVQGLRAMASLDRSVGEKIAVVVGLYCHSCLEHAALRDMIDYYGIDEGELAMVRYRDGKLPGYVSATTKSGGKAYLPYPHLGFDRYRPNAKECLTLFFKLYSPPRCRLCIDAMAEFADISIGDPWYRGWEAEPKLRQGYNLLIARTERGLGVLEEARREGAIALEPVPDEKVARLQETMVYMKRLRAFYGIGKRRRAGLPAPDYGLEKRMTGRERLSAMVNSATYCASGSPRVRRAIYRFFLSRAGRPLVGLIFFRRRVLTAFFQKARRRIGDILGGVMGQFR